MGRAKHVLLVALAIALIIALPLVAVLSVLPSQGTGVQWSSEGGYRGAPAVDGLGNLYLLVDDGTDGTGNVLLRSLDNRGLLRWELPLAGSFLPPVVGAEGDVYLVRTVRTVDEGAVYGEKALSAVMAVSPGGQVRWTYDASVDFPEHSMVVPPVVPGDGVVYLALASGTQQSPALSYVAALGPGGGLLWRCPVPGKVSSLLPPSPGRPLLAASSGNLCFIDGAGILLRAVDLGVPSVQAGPVDLNGTIVVGVDAGPDVPPEVWGLDREGMKRWNVSVAPDGAAPDRAIRSLFARGGTAFVLTSGGTEVRYSDASDRPAEITSLPAVLTAVSRDGEVLSAREVPGEASMTSWAEGPIVFSRDSIHAFGSAGEPRGSYPVPVGRWLNDLSVGPDGQTYLLQGGLWTGLVAVEGAPWDGAVEQRGTQVLWILGALALSLLLAYLIVRMRR